MNRIKPINYCIVLFMVCVLTAALPAVCADSPSEESVSLREKKDQEGYLVNLRDLIKRSKVQIERVGEKIEEQATLRRNQQRELKAREYYEKAMRLYEEGKLDEAREYWDKSIKITEHEEMKGYVRESVKKTKKQNDAFQELEEKRLKLLELERGYKAGDVDKKYTDAVKLFKQEKYYEAKVEFEDVEDMFPDHKAARSYIMIIDQEIQKEQKRLIDKKVREEALAKSNEKERWRRDLENEEKQREEKLIKQAADVYQEALTYYKRKDFKKAKDRFKETEWILPDYKSTRKYLARIDSDERKHEKKEKIETIDAFDQKLEELQATYRKEKKKQANESLKNPYNPKEDINEIYRQAVSLYKSRLYNQSREKFKEVNAVSEGYKKTEKYLAKIDNKAAGKRPSQASEKSGATRSLVMPDSKFKVDDVAIQQKIEDRYKRFAAQADEKYRQALGFYSDKDYTEAKRKFIETEAIYPDYQKTRKYLENIDADIASMKKKEPYIAYKELNQVVLTPVKEKVIEKVDQKKMTKKEIKLQQKKLAELSKAAKKAEKEEGQRLAKLEKENERIRRIEEAKQGRQDRIDQYAKDALLAQKEKERTLEKLARDERLENKKQAMINKKEEMKKAKLEEEASKKAVKKEVEAPDSDVTQLSEKQKLKLAEKDYQIAMKHYRRKEFKPALDKFRSANGYVPGYKLADNYVAYVKKLIGQRNDELVVESVTDYEDIAERKVKPVKELDEVKAVKQLAIDNRDRAIEKSKKRLNRTISKQERKNERNARERIEVIYDEALALYKEGRYLDAKHMFSNVQALIPGYKATEKYMLNCDDKLMSFELEKKELTDKYALLNEKQEERIKKEQTVKNDRLEKEALEKRRDELQYVYSTALHLYTTNRLAEAREKYDEFEKKLATGGFGRSYIKKMQKKVLADKKNVERIKSRNEERAKQIKVKEEIRLTKLEEKLEYEKNKDVVEMKEKIKTQEEQLAKEKKAEEERMRDEELKLTEKIEQKEKEVALIKEKEIQEMKQAQEEKAKEEMESASQSMEASKANIDSQKEKKLALEQEPKRKEIDLKKLVIARQRELDLERKKVQQEFEHQLDELYKQAVQLFNQGYDDDSYHMFNEIDQMQSGYKKTEQYIVLIEKRKNKEALNTEKAIKMEEAKKEIIVEKASKKQAKKKKIAIKGQEPQRKDIISQALDSIEGKI